MKKWFWILMLCLVGCGEQAENTLIIGISADYPPFEYQKGGVLEGFDVDFGEQLVKELKKDVQWQEMAFPSLVPSLQAGKIDMIISSVTSNPARAQVLAFSDTYYDNDVVVIIRPEDKGQNLKGKKVGAQLGSTLEAIAKTLVPTHQITLVSLPTNPQIIEELKLGRVDAMLVERAQAKSFIQVNSTLQWVELSDLVEVESPESGYSVAMRKHDKRIKLVNQAIARLKAKGILEGLNKKWFPHDNV